MTTLTGASLVWGSMTFYGDRSSDSVPVMSTLEGWDGLPSGRDGFANRPRGHGAFDDKVFADPRYVRVSGISVSAADRDALLVGLGATLTFDDELAPLTVTVAGRTLTAQARLLRYAPTLDYWGSGIFGWAAEWVCPDPYRYAPAVTTSTQFAQDMGGLEFDLFTDGTTHTGWLEFGDPGTIDGTLTMANPGTAPAWPVFSVAGPTPPEGFDLLDSATGRRLRFTGQVGTGSTLTIDSGAGRVSLDGVDRGTSLAIREWFSVAPASSTSVLFSPRGGPTSAVLSATVAPAFW